MVFEVASESEAVKSMRHNQSVADEIMQRGQPNSPDLNQNPAPYQEGRCSFPKIGQYSVVIWYCGR